MPFDYSSLIQPILQGANSIFGNSLTANTSSNSPFNLSTLLGSLLTGATALGREEPGYVTEARQAVRNIQQPAGYGSVFGSTISGLKDQFTPLLDQQAQKGIADISQRYSYAFPGTVGMQGGEIAGLEKYLREQLVPTQQDYLGRLALQGISQQQQAAQRILQENTDDPLRQGLATLAAAMLMKGIYGNGSGTGMDLGSIFGRTSSSGQQPPGGTPRFPSTGNAIVDTILGNIGPISMAIPGGISALTAPAFFGGTSALTTAPLAGLQAAEGPVAGELAAALGGPQSAASAAGTAGGFSIAGLLASLAAAAAGGGSGYLIGGKLPGTQLGATAAGAAGGAAAGAATGFVMGSVLGPPGMAIGATLGAIAGAVGGFFGSRGASHAQKAAALAADQKSQANNVAKTSSFWTAALGDSGYADMDGWGNFSNQQIANNNQGPTPYSYGGLSGTLDQPDAIARVGSQLLLKQLQAGAKMQGLQVPSSLDDIPGFRDSYISYIMQNYQIENKGNVSSIQNIGQAGGLLTQAGLPTPGTSTILARAGTVSQLFGNPDQPQRAEADELIGKIRAGGYTGPIPSGFYGLPGGIMIGLANGLIEYANGTRDQTLEAIFKGAGL